MSIKVNIIGDDEPFDHYEHEPLEEDFSVDLEALLEEDLAMFGEEIEEDEENDFIVLDQERLFGPKTKLRPTNIDYADRVADAYEGVFTDKDVHRAMSVITEILLKSFAEDKVVFIPELGHFYTKPRLLDEDSLAAFMKNMKRHQPKANIERHGSRVTRSYHFLPRKVLKKRATEAGRKRIIADAVARRAGPTEHRNDPSNDAPPTKSARKKSAP